MKKILFILTISLLFLFSACTNLQAEGDIIKDIPKGAASTSFSIDGMYCEACAYGMEAALEDLDGVYDAEISYEEATGAIVYDDKKVDKEDIQGIVDPYTIHFEK